MALTSDLKEPEIRYGSLDYGEYTFQAEAYNDLGQKIGEVEYHFAIARPFYLSYYAFALYLIVLTALVYFFSKWRANRAMEKKRKEYEAEQVQQNIKMREQEHLITLQQQQLLEAELSAKSKDLASMALGVFAKNEVLEKLRTVVQESLVKGQYGRKNLESLLKLINENIETQEFWDVFQNNFDLIHEKFARTLSQSYRYRPPFLCAAAPESFYERHCANDQPHYPGSRGSTLPFAQETGYPRRNGISGFSHRLEIKRLQIIQS